MKISTDIEVLQRVSVFVLFYPYLLLKFGYRGPLFDLKNLIIRTIVQAALIILGLVFAVLMFRDFLFAMKTWY